MLRPWRRPDVPHVAGALLGKSVLPLANAVVGNIGIFGAVKSAVCYGAVECAVLHNTLGGRRMSTAASTVEIMDTRVFHRPL